MLNFDGFQKFCTDFEIFPDILSKRKIMYFFKTLSGFFESTAPTDSSEREKVARRDLIDDHLFIEAVALTAFEIVY